MPASLLLSAHLSEPWCCKDLMPPFLPPCAYTPVCCFLRVLSGALIAGRNDSPLPCGCTCNAGQVYCSIKCTCNCLSLSERAVYTLACGCHNVQLLSDQQAACCANKCVATPIKSLNTNIRLLQRTAGQQTLMKTMSVVALISRSSRTQDEQDVNS